MNIVPTIVGVVFLVVGVLFILFPKTVQKYDQRMTRFVKDDEQYKILVYLFGIVFVFMGIAAIVLVGLFGTN